MTDEQLVGTHPRDALLVLRQKNLEIKKANERKNALIKARATYETQLEEFAKNFLADENVSLPPNQKEELAKIYASQCKKIIGLNLGFWSLFFVCFGLITHVYGFERSFPLIPFIGAIPISILWIRDKITLLRAKKLLKTISLKELESLDSPKKMPARESHLYNSPRID